MPPRAVDSARSQRRKTRYDLVPAGGSPHGARFSLVITKLPLWKIRSARPRGRFSLFSFPSSASLPIVVLLSRDRTAASRLSHSFFPRRRREIGNALSHPPSWLSLLLPPPPPSLLLTPSLFLSRCIEHPSSYSPRVFIPDRFVLLPVATPRDRPRLAQVTAIGNFNARPVLPNDFIQRNGCRGAARRGVASTIDAQTRDRHSILVYLRVVGLPLVAYEPPGAFVRRDLIFSQLELYFYSCIEFTRENSYLKLD